MNEIEVSESWYSRVKAIADKGIPNNERVVGVAIFVFSIYLVNHFKQLKKRGAKYE